MPVSRLLWKKGTFVVAVVMVPLLAALTGCSPFADKRQITYTVDFEVDGQQYSSVATNDCYKLWNFERGDYWIETTSKTVVRGRLKDGSRYVVGSRQGYACNGTGHLDVPSNLFVLLPGKGIPVVESFDEIHRHSPHHQVRIKRSFIDFSRGGVVFADIARKRTNTDAQSMPDVVIYQTVGAKLTPFLNIDDAKRDFYTGDCPKRADVRMSLGCTDAVFNFHPTDAVISNTDSSAVFDGHAFKLTMGRTSEAVTWFADPSVICHKTGCGFKGPGDSLSLDEKRDVVVDFENHTFALSPFIDRTFYLDPVTRRVVILYVDNVNLIF
ncbi:hypothetical protein PY254_00705 [Rhodanobacter sp. AS-Z3]|uniref:hypothetical protein n=1 Tax=Rhodanobacter sp. AS-Z3 TaxID=3031330 RepID=UPI0024798F70|nr:hypothetical protein [Rhodanobacter sp. AS-Z3]WEN15233.1 hypothetical protein PY254_00705 [Rhodanobacter sp. AS-Z3]